MGVAGGLRVRIALILAAVVIAVTGVLLAIGSRVVARGFGAVEQRQAGHRAWLGGRQLDEEATRIGELALDYAASDDLYEYVARPTSHFIENTIPPDWLPRVRLEVVAVIDSSGQPRFAKAIVDGQTIPGLPDGLLDHLKAGQPLVTPAAATTARSGLLVLPSGIWLLATRPITTSSRAGRTRGTFVLGRRVDETMLDRFSKAIAMPVRIDMDAPNSSAIGNGFRMRNDSPTTMTAYVPLQDVYGRAIGWLSIAVPREVEAQRRRTQNYLAGSVLASSGMLVIALIACLNRHIVWRMANLAGFLRGVDHTRDFNSRLLDSRPDEIGQVATAVNDLLETIAGQNHELEAARTQAVDALAETARQNQALEAANRLIEQMARTDGLTGLPNRRMFDERLDQQVSRSRRDGETFSLLLADIDHFKAINDRAGHVVGDRVLIHAASVFAASTRIHDTAARYGGEEFAVLLPGTPCEEAAHAAERIRSGIAALRVSDYEGQVTISIGVAEWRPGESCESLSVRADRLLYEAKRCGRNQVRTEVRAMRRSLRL